MSMMNSHLNPDIDTIFMMSDKKYIYVSSSAVKEVALFGGNIEEFVPPVVQDRLAQKMKEQSLSNPSNK